VNHTDSSPNHERFDNADEKPDTPDQGTFLETQAITPRNWKVPVSFALFALLSLWVFAINGSQAPVTFTAHTSEALIKLPDFSVNSRILGTTITIFLIGMTLVSFIQSLGRRRSSPYLVGAYALLFTTGLLGWVGAGGRVPLAYLATGAIAFAVPVVLGALAGVVGERAGILNIAIEGQLLMGAFLAAVIGSVTKNPLLGLISAMIGGSLVALVLAVFSIKYLVNQIIVGVVLNVLVTGITSFFYSALLTENSDRFNFPGTLPFIRIPILADIPLLGPALFEHRITTYAMFILVPAVGIFFYRTKYGLRLRSVGEHPLAADSVGIDVNRSRFWATTLAGLLAGLGGAALSIGNVGSFVREMSAGQGFIALACVILGRWNPWYASAAGLLFGFSRIFQVWAGQSGSGIPTDFIATIPYVVTLIAVAGFIGKSVGPAAAGKAYVK